MSVVIVILVITTGLVFWPGTPSLFLHVLKFLQPYDDAIFRARDVYRDRSQSGIRRHIYGAIYALMIGVPIAIILLLLAFAEFGRFIAPLTRAILGKP
jgi:hypothetical protein